MKPNILIADAGSTKTEWCLVRDGKKKTFSGSGISPYFLSEAELTELLQKEVLSKLKDNRPETVYYYGTGCNNPANAALLKKSLRTIFPQAGITVADDMTGAAISLCNDRKGIACILGTGSTAAVYNGKKIINSRPGLGYVLGDEGSGTYFGRKVLQHYLYGTFDAELMEKFTAEFPIDRNEILENVYRKPGANRYLAGFTSFLADNRGHFMVENIIEDGLHDFIVQHLFKFRETWSYPVHFTGGVAWLFRDVLKQMCSDFEFTCGNITKRPMAGLVQNLQQK